MKWSSLLLSTVLCSNCLFAQTESDTVDLKNPVDKEILSRTVIFQEISGAIVFPTLNVEYSFVRKPLWDMAFRTGGGILSGSEVHLWGVAGLSSHIGRKSSNLSLGTGVGFRTFNQRGNYSDDVNTDRFGFYNSGYHYYFSVGYRYEHKHGFIFGIDAYGYVPLNQHFFAPYNTLINNEDVYAWGGVTFGYRFPSLQTHLEWRERANKRRVLRPRKVRAIKTKDFDKLIVDSVDIEEQELEELAEWMEKKAQKKVKVDRTGRHAVRENSRSHFYIEGFGVAKHVSANYELSFPLKSSDLISFYSRVAVGGFYGTKAIHLYNVGSISAVQLEPQSGFTVPIGVGFHVMKNYRGGGIGGGIQPTIGNGGRFRLAYFVSHDIQFHIAHGLTAGVTFYWMIDPSTIMFSLEHNFWGGFQLGYRLPKKNKETP